MNDSGRPADPRRFSGYRTIRPTALGGLACLVALYGQTLLPDPLTRSQGTRWYAAGLILLILAWRGTYKNRDPAFFLSAGNEGEAPGNSTDERAGARPIAALTITRWAIIGAALLLNIASVVRLRSAGYESLAGGLGWLASLILLAAASARRGPRLARRTRGTGTDGEHRARLRRFGELAIVLAIFALGLCLRLYRLGDWTSGMHGDEGEVGLDALGILQGHFVSPFQTGWFGQPNFYYWGVALGMKLFGTGLGGLRTFSVLAGALLILPFYPLVRRLFGVRTAILASILLAISDVAIHFSRQEFSNITTPLFLVTGFFFFFSGLRSRRPLPFVLAGYAHTLCLYFYLGGRLTPLIAVAFFAYLMILAPLAGSIRAYRDLRNGDRKSPGRSVAMAALRRQFRNVRPYGRCVVLYALASCCLATPWVAYYFDHRNEWDARVREKLIFNQPVLMAATHGATHDPIFLGVRLPGRRDAPARPVVLERTPLRIKLSRDGFWPRVLWGQLKATLSIFTYHFDASDVYTFTREPVTKPIEAVLVVFGIAWALWRWRDMRMALLSIWFWLTIVVGGALTIDAPYMARLVGILPLLAIFAALVLNKLAAEFIVLCRTEGNGPLGYSVSAIGLIGLMGFLTWQNFTDYYVRYLGTRPFTPTAGMACFVRDFDALVKREGRPAPKYYSLGAHYIYWTYAVNRFLNRNSVGVDMVNASDALPILDNDDRDAVFVVWRTGQEYLPVIKLYYPGGDESFYRYGPRGHEPELFRYYRVKREQIEAGRSVRASYVPARGRAIQRSEGGMGSSGPPPQGLVYPVKAEWRGELFAPAFGRYRFRLESPGPARLILDGTRLLAANGRAPGEAEIVLARGLHEVIASGALPTKDSEVIVQWAAGDSALKPVPRRFLWSGPGRSLLGEIHAVEGPAARSPVIGRRVDGFLGFRDAGPALATSGPLTASWNGVLRISRPGTYFFDVFSNGGSTISIDGKLLVDNRFSGGAPRRKNGELDLRPGKHRFDVQYWWEREIGHLEVSWTPPSGPRAMIGPAELATTGGSWRPEEVEQRKPPPP
jgi:hypothetical protein